MTDQELKEIRERFQNRLKGSEEYSVFLSHHEPDIARLLAEVERLQKILSKAGLCSFCGEELDGELKTGGMLTGVPICYGCVDARKKPLQMKGQAPGE